MAEPGPLSDLAVLTLVVAHGTDASLDPRETRVLVEQIADLAAVLDPDVHSGADLGDVVEQAVDAYGDLSVVGLDTVVARFRDTVPAPTLARAHAALVQVARADGVVHTMERTVLRHLAQAWDLDGSPDA